MRNKGVRPMVRSAYRTTLFCRQILSAGLIALLPQCLLSQATSSASAPPPVRVAIVGLTHDHVAGFLGQLPQHHEVQLVGIAEPDPVPQAKYQQKYSLPDNLFFKDMAKMI